jgi:hypothetical protein
VLIYAFLNGVEIHWVRISTLFGDDQHLAYINTFIADPKLPDVGRFLGRVVEHDYLFRFLF